MHTFQLEMWRIRATKLTEQMADESAKKSTANNAGIDSLERSASPIAEQAHILQQHREQLESLRERLSEVERENAELKGSEPLDVWPILREADLFAPIDELSAFDPAFFEELEDLKWNYKESVRLNVQYEHVIRDLCGKVGVDAEEVIKDVQLTDDEGADGGEDGGGT